MADAWPAAAGGALGCGAAAARRYHGSRPKPPPVVAGSRLSYGLGAAVSVFMMLQLTVEFKKLKSVVQGMLWSPIQSYLEGAYC